jgi:hypothetical protein
VIFGMWISIRLAMSPNTYEIPQLTNPLQTPCETRWY